MRTPWSALRDRTPVAPPLPKDERRRIKLNRIADNDLIFAAVAGAGLAFVWIMIGTPQTVGGWVMLTFVAGFFVWTIVQSTRKWMLARADHAASNLI
jgi:hypothetical protein